MKLKEVLNLYEKNDPPDKRTERGELMKEFLTNLNLERNKKFPPLNFPRLGRLLEGLDLQDLYTFLSMCNDRKRNNGSFSKYFWWALKNK